MSVPLRIEHSGVASPERCHFTPRRRRISRPVRRMAGIGAISAALSILGLAGVGAVTLLHGLAGSSDLHLLNTGSSSGLSAVMGSAHRANGYVTVTGSVSNRSGRLASNVEAVVELIDAQNRTVQLDRSMVAFASVPSGNCAPFRVIIPDDSNATGYRLSFKHPDGRELEYR